MSEIIAGGTFLEVLHEAFDMGQKLTFTPTGRSMLPMLDGKKDKVTFSPKPGKLKKYDVAFYRRPETGQLVLHRMVGFDKDGGYIFSGDGQYYYEYGICDEDILALMTSFTHKGKEHRVEELGYRIYIRRMIVKKKLWILLRKIYHRMKRSSR